MSNQEGYSPIESKKQKHINAGWKAYRDTFSLEGEELFLLLQSGADKTTILQRMNELKAVREELLPLWEREWLTQK